MGLELIDIFPTHFLGVIFVLAGTLIAVGGLLIVRKSVPLDTLTEHHEVAGFIYAVVGVIYAVLLAFVVIVVWEQRDAAQQTVQSEAATLASLYHDSQGFSPTERVALQQEIRTYAEDVIQDDWPALMNGNGSPKAEQAITDLEQDYVDYLPKDMREADVHQESLRLISRLEADRAARIFQSGDSIPLTIWGVLLFGWGVTIGFSYFFGVKNLTAQVLMTASLASITSAILFVILATNHPYSGEISIRPDAFVQFLTYHGDR